MFICRIDDQQTNLDMRAHIDYMHSLVSFIIGDSAGYKTLIGFILIACKVFQHSMEFSLSHIESKVCIFCFKKNTILNASSNKHDFA